MRSLAFALVPLYLLASPTPAQTRTITIPVTQAAAPSYAGESYVIEHSESRYVMAADGTGYRERTIAFRVQSEAALREIGVLTIPFASASEKIEILYARVRRPDGTVIETPAADAMEQPAAVTREAPFYSDLKEKQLPIKSLRVGDTLEWKARITRTRAEAPNQFWGQESFLKDVVSLDEICELRVPASVAVNVWTNPALNQKPTESTEGADHIYRWHTSSLTPTTGPEAEAVKAARKKKVLTPEEEKDLREGALPSIAWTTFKSWADVGAWYASLEKSRVVPDDQVKAKVAELTAGKSTEEEKVRAVYAFVAPQIRYIGVAFGIGRYQPHLASEVLDNQYGDCKDKHTLLAAMLTVLGLHPDAVLIGEGIRFNEAVPSPSAFNHLITRVSVTGTPIWLDATAEVAPYRVLAYDLRDKASLVIPETAEARIEHTPADLPFPSFKTWVATGEIDKQGVSNSHITYTLRGDEELIFRVVLRQVPPANYPELAQKISESLGYQGTTSHPTFTRPEDTADPITWSYDYKREQGGDWNNRKIIAQLPYNGFPMYDDKEPPTSSIQLGWPRTETSTSAMKLPAGWGAELPEAVHAKSDFATFDQTYRFQDGTVFADQKIVVLKKELPVADYKSYKKFIADAGLNEQTYIQLTHTGSESTSSTAPATVNNAAAAKLVSQANDALRKRDFLTSSQLLDKARDINPTQKDLNGEYGAVNYNRGEMTEATRYYQKEVALHPDSLWVYGPMSRAQTFTNHPADAVASLRAWASAAPSDPAATIALVNLLLTQNDNAAALAAATTGIAALPEDKRSDPNLQLALGKAQAAAGHLDDAATTFVAQLKTVDDPLALNNAAYELSKTGKELPLAEASSRKALDMLATESQTWTLDETPATLQQKTSLIISSWDTLGWILVHENKYQDAEPLIDAAWHSHQHEEIGEHLGDIQAHLGQHQQAWQTYALTLATIPIMNMYGVRTPPGPDSKRLNDKMSEQKKAGAKPDKADANSALTHLRSLSLGPAGGRNGSAEYLVLLSHGHIEKAQPTGEKSIPGGADLILKADASAFIPANSNAKLAKSAILNCHSDTCDLIFEP